MLLRDIAIAVILILFLSIFSTIKNEFIVQFSAFVGSDSPVVGGTGGDACIHTFIFSHEISHEFLHYFPLARGGS